jgi:hypothetical protein
MTERQRAIAAAFDSYTRLRWEAEAAWQAVEERIKHGLPHSKAVLEYQHRARRARIALSTYQKLNKRKRTPR